MFNENVRDFCKIIIEPLERKIENLQEIYQNCPNELNKQKLEQSQRLLIEYYKKFEQVVYEEYLFQKELNQKIKSSL